MAKEKDGLMEVLNLIINGLPSKQKSTLKVCTTICIFVLNLIINGLPSKLKAKRGFNFEP